MSFRDGRVGYLQARNESINAPLSTSEKGKAQQFASREVAQARADTLPKAYKAQMIDA